MKITSSAFKDGEKIPSKYTCDGQGINPPISFQEVPKNSKSLVLIMDDHDVPKNLRKDGIWDHWTLFNIDPTTTAIAENNSPKSNVGVSTGGVLGYEGACPPDREHRYIFKLFALDTKLDLKEGCTKTEVEKAMKGHIIDQAQLLGRYERGKVDK